MEKSRKKAEGEYGRSFICDINLCCDNFWTSVISVLIFRNGSDLPDMIKRLGGILPAAIMAILVVYCLKDVGNNFIADGVWRLTAVLIVVVSYKWKHNTLLRACLKIHS